MDAIAITQAAKTTRLFRKKSHWLKEKKKLFSVNSIQYVNLQIIKMNTVTVPKFKTNVLIIYQ